VELIEELLPEHYTVEQETRKQLNEDLLHRMLDEVPLPFLYKLVTNFFLAIQKYIVCHFQCIVGVYFLGSCQTIAFRWQMHVYAIEDYRKRTKSRY